MTAFTLSPPIEIATGPQPRTSIIMLHGLGADGHDFEPLAQELDFSAIEGGVRWVFPHAPTMPVTINAGYVMRAWYDILGTDLVRREDEAGLRASAQAIAGLIDREIERGTPSERIVLAGFSQGCAMTLMTGLRYPRRLAGLVGLSGYLPLADRTQAERHAANQNTPIFMAHGSADPVVPLVRAQASHQTLAELGYGMEWHTYPMPHSVCTAELQDLHRWLMGVWS